MLSGRREESLLVQGEGRMMERISLPQGGACVPLRADLIKSTIV